MANEEQKDSSQPKSRYERVREILNAAQGDAHPNYQGYGKFWELPLEQFLRVKLYGIPMIADEGAQDFCEENMPTDDESQGSCCSSSFDDEEAATPVEDDGVPQPPGEVETPADADLPALDSDEIARRREASKQAKKMTTDAGEESSGGSCCGGSSGGGGQLPPSKGRGAASGLIKGLKGEFPFDGTQFPRLPWGGSPVASSDIIFIQSWIDDGCPATDADAMMMQTGAGGEDQPIRVVQSLKLARAQGHEEHPLSSKSINEYRNEAGKRKIRKNIAALNDDELKRLRHCIRVMRCYDKFYNYDPRSFRYWADIHANNCQHGWEQFLSWHRLYLYYFEQQLQDIDPTVTLPYWDWPQYRNDVVASVQDMSSKTPTDNGTVPKAYRCFVDERMLQSLKGKIPDDMWLKLKSVEGTRFNSGNRLYLAAGITFTGTATDDLVMTELQNTNPMWQRNRWPGGDATIIFEAYPTPEDVERILQIKSFFNFGSGPTNNHFFGALENIHNLIHNFSGGSNPNFNRTKYPREPQYGDMVSAGLTARDMIFWGHHSNVDRLWAEWQKLHPGSEPDDPTDVLAPWTLNVEQVLSTSKLGYEYMNSSALFETDSNIPITRFKSAKAPIHPAVLAKYSRAEIRLHKVQYSTAAGAFIRVFLNEPDANEKTPTRGNDHFVTQIATFSGECIGGPGHCDVPTQDRRKFDLRPRHRKTPGNFRIDATETIRKLTGQGATDFHINLVVLDIDGTPKPNALWLDAVSLNFKD
ncbi:MAG TPA: tyrosinase family protein [Pyrinomonadaceae bacterium]|jgi:tyrosinase